MINLLNFNRNISYDMNFIDINKVNATIEINLNIIKLNLIYFNNTQIKIIS